MSADIDTVVAVVLLGIAAVTIIALAIIRPSFPDAEPTPRPVRDLTKLCMVPRCANDGTPHANGFRECDSHRAARTVA